MRFLITGASGHLGSYLTKRLVEEGAAVFALVRERSDLWRLAGVLSEIDVLRGDLANSSSLAGAIRDAAPDVVVHLAWHGVTSEYRNDREQVSLNLTGSLELFHTVQSAGCACWIGVGTQAEYGPYTGVITEDFATWPQTAYGLAKLCTGLLTRKLCELAGMRYVWLRLFATYGPKDDERHLIPRVIKQLLSREAPPLTPGEQLWDYLYVEDAAEAIRLAAITPQAHGIYNLGSGKAHEVRSIVERIRDLIDPSLPLGIGELPYPLDQVMHLQADISALSAVTGWAPEFELDEGLRSTVDWYRSAYAT